MNDAARPRIAIGPTKPGWGSWEWLGADLAAELTTSFPVTTFVGWQLPTADVVVVVKHLPPPEWFQALPAATALVYAPADLFDSCGQIDAAGMLLFRCQRIVIHCERLRKYFAPYAAVEYLDHHVKYVVTPPVTPRREGPILWTGVRPNLPPLVDWVNRHPLPADLVILTDVATEARVPTAADLGFARPGAVRVERWSPEVHRAWLGQARAAIDIKGEDFRSRHKPATKAMDFLASGLPLAMNPDSSPVEHLAKLGFVVPTPLDHDTWLSATYATEVARFGAALQELLARRRVGLRWRRLLLSCLSNHTPVPAR